MAKKQIFAGVLAMLLVNSVHIFAVDVFLGIRAEGAITRSYGNIGLYTFTGMFNFPVIDPDTGVPDPDATPGNVTTLRSTNQAIQFSGGAGFFVQIAFNDWYTLMPEVMFAFNRGLTVSGNYRKDIILNGPDFPELTGQIRYSWMAFNINVISQFNVLRPNEMFSFHVLAGPAMSIMVGNIKERFTSDFGMYNKPYNADTTNLIRPTRRFDIGVTAGIGTNIDFGKAGRLTFDVRTTWYFVPQLYTYLSPNKRVRMSLPMSLNLGYAIKLM
ncbi:PorT family protein [Entomospira entomophila]|uniref:PorT family protein n=1 Tax=Entomospira entomophila TaxID=2719988 RepID=A0A968KWA0_9SPIO|nr:PorT family protein [Entomospira entomophilus]NIZ40620.1 PorT family protein [Entomospira entomophilus]WDI34835.1 PorT family protein [Entomospira entomophilus]